MNLITEPRYRRCGVILRSAFLGQNFVPSVDLESLRCFAFTFCSLMRERSTAGCSTTDSTRHSTLPCPSTRASRTPPTIPLSPESMCTTLRLWSVLRNTCVVESACIITRRGTLVYCLVETARGFGDGHWIAFRTFNYCFVLQAVLRTFP